MFPGGSSTRRRESEERRELRSLLACQIDISGYNRYAYDAEKRAALDTWARTLTQILEPNEAGTVVSFEKRASHGTRTQTARFSNLLMARDFWS